MMSKIDISGDGGISIDDFVEFNAKWVHILIKIFGVYIKNFRNQFAGNFPVEDSVKDQVMLLFTNKYLHNAAELFVSLYINENQIIFET